jgi:hypothetical protein
MTPEELPDLPAASTRHGDKDQALDRATAIRILTLRANRFTYAQIAEELGYSDPASARNALMRALDRHEAENVQQLRTLENLALDADERQLRTIILDAENRTPTERIHAIDARTRLSARRSRLNGMDAPQQLVVSSGAYLQVQEALTALRERLLPDDDTVPGEVTDRRDDDDTAGEGVPGSDDSDA